MRVLVISRNSWDDTNSIGNTLTNFFTGIDDIEFASIYFRSASPDNELCKWYYRTTELEVLKKWFCPKKIGKQFHLSGEKTPKSQDVAGKKEKKLIRQIHKHSVKLAYKLSDYIWYSEKWMNENLKSFVESFSPDVVFAFVKSAPQYYLTIKYLRENFNVPLMTWIADDEYTGLQKSNSTREINNLKYILGESQIVTGCSQEICDYYNSVFGCQATPLYKGCDLSKPVKKFVNKPIKIVYAGNLLYGRLEIIRKVAQILEDYSFEGKEVIFEIYSNTLLSDEEQKFFVQKSSSKYMGQRDYTTIKQELSSSDIVLHVESFEDSEILKTRYSFSTKIIDCLQSGSVLLSVGPKNLASIEYVRKINGACVIDNQENLREELCALLDDCDSFCQRAKEIRMFAQKHHDCNVTSKELRCTLEKITKEG